MSERVYLLAPQKVLALMAVICLGLGLALTAHAASPQSGSLSSAGVAPAARLGASRLSAATLAGMSSAIASSAPAYAFEGAGSTASASNPAQRLDVRAARSGIAIGAQSLNLGLSLQAAGYGNTLRALPATNPTAKGNRVSFRRGSIEEFYANGPAGVEQGFTVAAAPSGVAAASGPLTLRLAVTGNARARLSSGATSVSFSRAGTPSLDYGGLVASDASGHSLRSWITLSGRSLLLHVDARGARFPLNIDPLVRQGGKLTAGEALEGGRLGFSVALSADGNTALIGAPGYNAGVAWVFTRSGSTWSQQGPELAGSESEGEGAGEHCGEEAEEPAGQCGFGRSVAISGDGNTALIGGPRDGHNAGAAWVFTRSGSTWTQLGSKLKGFEEGGEGRFGRSVALSSDGSTALIGGPSDRAGHGAAWVFTRSGSTWQPVTPKLTGRESEESGESHFGGSVALSGDGTTAIVGSPGDAQYTGAIWAFVDGNEGWRHQGSKLTASGELGDGHFGVSVALSLDGNTVLTGARYDQATPGVATGAAWAYTRSGATWSQLGEELRGSEETGGGEFGYSVALSGDGQRALMGGQRDNGFTGAAWSFDRTASGFTQPGRKLEVPDELGKGWYGASVALSGDGETALVGSPYDSRRIGAAWAFAEGPEPTPVVTGVSPSKGPRAGGTTVTITGIDFLGTTAVSFGSTPAASFTVNSGSSITAVSPPGTGTVDLTVTGPGGPSATGPEDLFQYIVPISQLPPSVGRVAPTEGPSGGGTSVTITGSNLSGATAVSFGAKPASSFTVSSSSSITAVSPAEAAGTVDVTVTTANGTSRTGTADRFTFLAGSSAGSSASTSGTPAGGVLGFGGGSLCTVTLRSKHIAVQAPTRAALRLVVTGAGRCAGKLRLRVKLRRTHHRFVLRTIGTAVFSVPAGRGAVVKMNLNVFGRRLLARGHGRLNASVLITRVTPAPQLAKSASVRLARVKTRKPAAGHK
ncbi:MAG TPA: IPT/TIG domain-containing protein [Solirubrobacteraceae bacterium]